MLHKISDFCNKIDTIKEMSDKLRVMKYSQPKASDVEINNLIVDIQHQMYVLSQDKQEYAKKKSKNTDTDKLSYKR